MVVSHSEFCSANLKAMTQVASALVTTAIVSPLVNRMSGNSRPYKPFARRTIQHIKPHTELRFLTCVHDEDSVPSLLNLFQLTTPTPQNPLCIYVMHLVELVGRAAPLLIPHKPDPLGSRSSSTHSDSIFTTFYSLQKLGDGHRSGTVQIQPYVAISPFPTMHHDVCSLALQNKVSLIILPFHRRFSVAGSLDVVDYALQTCNPRVLAQAPCSVGILVDRAAGIAVGGRFSGASTSGSALYRISMTHGFHGGR